MLRRITIGVALSAAIFIAPAAATVHAETGPSNTQDIMCDNQAYLSMHNGDHKCDGAKHPADYGSWHGPKPCDGVKP